jgi:hypothetical protein
MPDPDNGVLDVEISHDDSSPSTSRRGKMAMDPAVAGLMVQQLTQTGIIAQNNFVTVQKVVDYDYLENKRMVTLDEAVGIREVSSKKVPAGPTTD